MLTYSNYDVTSKLGLVFDDQTDEEIRNITNTTSASFSPKETTDRRFAIILAPLEENFRACFFGGKDSMTVLDVSKLTELRKLLPRVEFIKSDLAMGDQFVIGDLVRQRNKLLLC